MALYTSDSIERVKLAVDMVALVGTRTDLRRVGTRHVGLCPFHDERTPSFSVSSDPGLYHCFGCGESGDAIRFVEKTEALDFKEAVEALAERSGVELKSEREDPQAEERRRRKERLLALTERTADFYARYFWKAAEAAPARAYLEGRGLGEQVLRDFRVGYAPSAWDKVILAAQRDGFTQEQIAAAGLGQRGRSGGFFDRFRDRIMFPLADARGRVLGFGARAMRDDQGPKYLNSSENELYHKGRQLFGIDHGRAAAAKAGRVLVVEGYTDVLALHQAGLTETVAIMGTALTPEQLAELARAAPLVYLALDADRSGQEAMLRAARGAAERGVELRVVGMPEGTDPAELVASEGPEAFTALLESAMSVPEFEVRRALEESDLDSPRGRDRALEAVRPLIGATPRQSVVRDELVRRVADRLDVPTDYVTSARATVAAPSAVIEGDPGPDADHPVTQVSPLDVVTRTERAVLAMCIGPHDADRARRQVGREYLHRLSDENLSSPATRRARQHLIDHLDEPLASLPEDDPTLAALITHIAAMADEEPSSESALELSFLQLELRRIERRLRQVREAEDYVAQRTLFAEREAVRERVNEVMGRAD